MLSDFELLSRGIRLSVTSTQHVLGQGFSFAYIGPYVDLQPLACLALWKPARACRVTSVHRLNQVQSTLWALTGILIHSWLGGQQLAD